jgi:3-phenylpropionate/cinnamic acid dioxygenase small subunit
VEEDDVGMTAMTVSISNSAISLDEAITLIWTEADLLDRRDYEAWLALWTRDGHYVIPVDPDARDHVDMLNYAYDDADMRRMRVDRLVGGHAISSTPAARSVRTLSRFRLMEAGRAHCVVHCAQHLVEYKFERQRLYAADVIYRLTRADAALKLDEKIVRLINAGDALGSLSYLL